MRTEELRDCREIRVMKAGMQYSQGQEDESRSEGWPGNESPDEGWLEDDWREMDWREEERKERERQQRRRQRIEEMKREKHRREMMYRYGVPAVLAAAILCILLLVVGIVRAARPKEDVGNKGEASFGELLRGETAEAIIQEGIRSTKAVIQEGMPFADDAMQAGGSDAGAASGWQEAASAIGTMLSEAPKPVFEAHTTDNTSGFSDSVNSDYGILIDVESGEVLAQKNGWDRINPASMTKILTVLVAAENITDFEGTFTMNIEITDYSFSHGCSNTGFEVGEVIPVKDLFYGTALKSGADAALGLAYYTAGSQEAFVEMMNAKLEEMGLSGTTHFTNCVGLYDEAHYSTPYDMAIILKEAADNEFCRQVLSEHHYVTSSTAEHPEGIDISNWFLRRIEDRDTHGEVLCAKTGFVDQSKNCAASLAADHSGKEYICVTAGSDTGWTCIGDHVELYQRYLPE